MVVREVRVERMNWYSLGGYTAGLRASVRRMEEHDVERIIRGVLSDLEAPFSLIVLNQTATGWQATFKAARGGLIMVALPDGPPPSIRTAVAQRIEAEL